MAEGSIQKAIILKGFVKNKLRKNEREVVKMDKQNMMKELLERYEQLKFVDKHNKYILEERINELERMLKELL